MPAIFHSLHRSMKYLLVLLILVSATAASSIISQYVYNDVNAAMCVRLLNATGPIGCSSPRNGVIAPLYPITTLSELSTFESKQNGAKIIVLHPNLLLPDTLTRLANTENVAGVLVLYADYVNNGWSPDEDIPQKAYDIHGNSGFKWNPTGNGLSKWAMPFPIAQLPITTSSTVLAHARTNMASNGVVPQYAGQIYDFMHTNSDAQTCLRRHQCQPVGGFSVWGAIGGQVSTVKDAVMAVASMDADALFHDLAHSDSRASGVAAVLAAVKSLSAHTNTTSLPKQIIAAIFDAESWGYAGSQRFLDDVRSFKCEKVAKDGSCDKPWKLSLEFQKLNIAKMSVIEVNQIMLQQNATLYTHRERNTDNITSNLVDFVIESGQYFNAEINAADTTTPGLPPGSAQSFHVAGVPAITVTDHGGAYNNRLYNSRFNDADGLMPLWNGEPLQNVSSTFDALCLGSKVLARALWLAAGGDESDADNIVVDCAYAYEVYSCIALNTTCPLSSRYTKAAGMIPSGKVPSRYASVYNFAESYTTWFIHQIFDDLLAVNRGGACSVKKACSKPYKCVGGTCVVPVAQLHDAWPTGLSFNYAKNWFEVTDTSKPVWVEADWDSLFGVRVMIQDTTLMEAMSVVIGVVVTAIAAIGMVMGKRMYAKYAKND